ncbi:RecBCD enzyme subunit RecB [Mycobacterium avium subsp. paratuberculosis]|nr:RecBCD enzyme subunit RecB [Mycobacterium avium subsp. paratuberculosis]CAG6849325.1 RecBCD enzyme subunit RecB [Mycobacterium avium subsp. paratuberculosis]CAG6849350.1 RecBCD enzyme subunit RecB [Mycobacterium avium subsp. paratuberculosis]CAG6849478.1 RecBCD enzyme subunit RecB [Mycobacterium avium subsp. paratuberculosis]CAG6851702.1 RecBCD enzyme subunit RecB [Mycobacterium avium subsp. paratuberculosis]
MFFGETAETLAAGGDALTDRIAQTLREWAGHSRERGVAAIFEAAQLLGMSNRVLGWQGGARHMTDLAHLTQLLGEVAHREHHNLPALRDWLRRQRDERSGAPERNRRLDSDAAAVQIMTVFVSKGLQYPIVYLPFAFHRNTTDSDVVLFHDEDGTRCLHVGGKDSPDFKTVERLGRKEDASDDSRLTYVALTRAQAQVVAWWSPAYHEPNGGLSRLLRGRRPGEPVVPDRCEPAKISDADALARLREWEAAGGPVIEESVPAPAPPLSGVPVPARLENRHFHRGIDTGWRRTSYSGLIRQAQPSGVGSEPEAAGLDDEVGDILLAPATSVGDVASPMADLPAGATFGTLVHAVLQTADPFAPDLAAELTARIREHSVWWPVAATPEDMAAAMVPMHDTPLGPLAGGLTLRRIGLSDRLCELDFELPLAGGDRRSAPPEVRLADLSPLLRAHLPADDVLACYADRLTDRSLGAEPLRGYLTGSIDAVLRIPDGAGHRYLVVDYKTNRLGDAQHPLTAADYDRPRMVEAMLHSDYPLQALLYSAVLHRFLRWRLAGYEPDRHLGGILYLFVRGMCGPDTPVRDGHPSGVFDWRPPSSLITALSDLLDAQGVAV